MKSKRCDAYELQPCSSRSNSTSRGNLQPEPPRKESRSHLASKRFRRTCIMISCVLAVFLITWSPYFLLKIVFFVDQNHPMTKSLLFHQIAYITSILPPVLNPMLYIYKFPAIKQHFGRIKQTVVRNSEAPRTSVVARKNIVVFS